MSTTRARTREDDTTAHADTEIGTGTRGPGSSHNVSSRGTRWWLPALVLVVAAAAAAWWFLGNSTAADEPVEAAAPLSFAEVVRTDLVQQSSLAGTLGRVDATTITSRVGGTVTSAPDPGTTVTSGETLFAVDGQPVVLLEGSSPAWRAMSVEASGETFVGSRAGTVTSVAEVGSVVTQGSELYAVDNEPVIALFGGTPAFRDMRVGDIGPDVLQLETALVALGYDPDLLMTVDEEFTSFTSSLVQLWETDLGLDVDGIVSHGDVIFIPRDAQVTSVPLEIGASASPGQPVLMLGTGEAMSGDDVAQLEAGLEAAGYDIGTADGSFDADTRLGVMAWQADLGTEADGVVELGDVVFGDRSVRVADNLIPVGDSVNPGASVLAVTSEATVITVDLPAADQGTLSEGQVVDVELPDSTVVPATVTSVSTVASITQNGDTTFPAEVVLDDPADAGSLEEAPVEVLVVTDSVEGALAVPVASLLTLAEGGYAVEVEVAGGTQLIGVEPGFFADGFVDVTGANLDPGDRVVVP